MAGRSLRSPSTRASRSWSRALTERAFAILVAQVVKRAEEARTFGSPLAQFRGLLGTRGQSELNLRAGVENQPAAKPGVCSSFLKMELGGLEPPASWVRFGRPAALSLLVCGDFVALATRSEHSIQVNLRPFRLGSGQRSNVLARTRLWPSYVCPTWPPVAHAGSDDGRARARTSASPQYEEPDWRSW